MHKQTGFERQGIDQRFENHLFYLKKSTISKQSFQIIAYEPLPLSSQGF
jgi:hypothetical protein